MGFIGSLLRFAIYLIVSWFALVALWLGLPSPSREYSSDAGRYALTTLRAGRPLVRVYDRRPYLSTGYHVGVVAGEQRSSFALSYKLEPKRNTTLLTLTDGLTIDLSPEYITSYPFVSQERFTVARTGDQDGINPPWFARADAMLLFWWLHRDEARLSLKVRWRDTNNIEIWLSQTTISDTYNTDDATPLIRLSFDAPPPERGNQLTLLKNVVLPRQSSSPSTTYAIRLSLLVIIAPLALLVLGSVESLGPIVQEVWDIAVISAEVVGFYCAFVAIVWIVRGGRPIPVNGFLSKFPFLGGRGAGRNASRGRTRLWGPSGPIEINDDEDRPEARQPICNVGDFFRSSSPLDDLLASFENTRHYTEPITWRSQPMSGSNSSMHPNASNGDLSRHRKIYLDNTLEDSGFIDLEKVMPE